MIKLSRRQIVLAAVCAGLVVLPLAGWATERSAKHPAAAPSSAPFSPAVTEATSVAPTVAGDASGSPSPSPSETSLSGPESAPGAGTTFALPAMPAPIGWKLSDIPHFDPPPAPEPVVLPPGDQVPYISQVPVTQKVAFLTIDDGFFKNPEAVKLFAAAHIPVTLFLETDAIRDDPQFFDQLRGYGAVIEAHTISHPDLAGKGYELQHHQICGGADELTQWYGRRPLLFRPPFGDKDATTLRVTKECGMKAAFFWRETVDKGKVRYQTDEKVVQPGDIILMHFRPAFIKDFIAALQAIKRAGLTPALLENYVPGAI